MVPDSSLHTTLPPTRITLLRLTRTRHNQLHTMASSSAAAGLLSRQLKQMQNDKSISGISCGLVDSNVFEWEVMLMIDDDTKFYGGKNYHETRHIAED